MNFLLEQYNILTDKFNKFPNTGVIKSEINMSNSEYLQCQDILKLMKERGYISILDTSTLSGTSYLIVKKAEFDEFLIWLKHEIKRANKLKRKDYIIAIVSALIGALIGLIPTFINFLFK